MNDILALMPVLITGMFLGGFFFGGLWWTVRKGLTSLHPATWFMGSLVLRTSITLAGFYIISGGQWEKLLICLLGFSIVRPLVTRLAQLPQNPSRLEQRESHAP